MFVHPFPGVRHGKEATNYLLMAVRKGDDDPESVSRGSYLKGVHLITTLKSKAEYSRKPLQPFSEFTAPWTYAGRRERKLPHRF
jgi:hypothetical protein